MDDQRKPEKKEDDIFSEFDYRYNMNDLGNELLKHILTTHANLIAMRDLLIDIAASVQDKKDEDVFKQFQRAHEEYARRLLTEWTGKYGELKDPKGKLPPT